VRTQTYFIFSDVIVATFWNVRAKLMEVCDYGEHELVHTRDYHILLLKSSLLYMAHPFLKVSYTKRLLTAPVTIITSNS
jgi:hypothetical protein